MICNREQWLNPDHDRQEPAAVCDMCGGDVYPGEYLTQWNGKMICDDCLRDEIGELRHELEETGI